MEDMTARRRRRGHPLPPSRDQLPGQHPDRRGRRPVRGPPQPLRLLPLDHRLADLRAARRRLRTPAPRPAFEADDPQLLVHHPEPLPRRPRLAVRQRRARRPRDGGRVARATTCRRSSAPPPSATGPSDRHLRRGGGRRLRRRLQRLLQRAAGSQPDPPDTPGALNPGPGGGRVGAVLVSPCIKPGTVDTTPYNHYSLLRSIERNWQLPFLGYAGQQGLVPLGPKALNRPGC